MEVNRHPWMGVYSTDFGGAKLAVAHDNAANFLSFKLPHGFPLDPQKPGQGQSGCATTCGTECGIMNGSSTVLEHVRRSKEQEGYTAIHGGELCSKVPYCSRLFL